MSMTDDQELFRARLDDLTAVSMNNYTPSFTKFLDGRQLVSTLEYLSKYKNDILAVKYGGFTCAERCIVGIFPRSIYEYAVGNEAELYDLFEISALNIKGSGYRKFTHRDFLGSVLSLGIKRDTIGDIFVDEEKTDAFVVVTSAMSAFIADSLEYIANDKVKVRQIEIRELPELKQDFSVISGTVASFRLDCVLSLAIGQSREKAKRLIEAKLVSVDHAEELKCDAEIEQGMLLSVKGTGRFRVDSLGDVTKKGRNRIVIHKMI